MVNDWYWGVLLLITLMCLFSYFTYGNSIIEQTTKVGVHTVEGLQNIHDTQLFYNEESLHQLNKEASRAIELCIENLNNLNNEHWFLKFKKIQGTQNNLDQNILDFLTSQNQVWRCWKDRLNADDHMLYDLDIKLGLSSLNRSLQSVIKMLVNNVSTVCSQWPHVGNFDKGSVDWLNGEQRKTYRLFLTAMINYKAVWILAERYDVGIYGHENDSETLKRIANLDKWIKELASCRKDCSGVDIDRRVNIMASDKLSLIKSRVCRHKF